MSKNIIQPTNDINDENTPDEYGLILREHPDTMWMYFTAKPRCELNLQEVLRRQSIPCYVPMIRKVTTYSRSTYTRMLPMFPGYVFASTSKMGYDLVMMNSFLRRVYHLDAINAKKLLKDLITVRKFELLATEHKVEVRPELKVKTPILITKGYFKGEYATITRFTKHDEVEVLLTSLQMAISAQVPLDFVEKA